MSIIHKALKKAEESRSGEKKPDFKVSRSGDDRKAGLLVAGLATVVVVVSFGVYLYIKWSPEESRLESPGPSSSVSKQGGSINTSPPGTSDTDPTVQTSIEYMNTGRYREAEGILKTAVERSPEDPVLWNLMGVCARRLGRNAEAIRHYEKALNLMPDYPEAMNNKAVAIEAADRKKEAINLYKDLTARYPDYTEARLNFALLLETEGKTKDARREYEAFLSKSQDEDLKRLVRKRLSYLK